MDNTRLLKFAVNNQHIMKDKGCNFSGLVSGSEGILKAMFGFSNHWDGMNKVAVFNMLGVTKMEKLDKEGCCIIPSDVLKFKNFYVGVIGEVKGRDGIKRRLKTDTVKVIQKVV